GVEQEFDLGNSLSERIYDSADSTQDRVDPIDRIRMGQVGFQEDSQNTLSGFAHAAVGSSGSMAYFAPTAIAGPGAPLLSATIGRYMLGGASAKETEDRLAQLSNEQLMES
ncbi:hypothetical protein RZS08_01195, partial [Arthrospira platensis SPKY1]|nr:hypothetical protein [Arthrospira platensis SPKY1]